MSQHLRFPDGSAARVSQDAVVLEAIGTSKSAGARQFCRDYSRQQDGWRDAWGPDWPLPFPSAPGMILGGAPKFLRKMVGKRLREAKLLTLRDDEQRRPQIIALLWQIYGLDLKLTHPPETTRRREVILLLTQDCYREIGQGRSGLSERARMILRHHPNALVQFLTPSAALSAPRPLASVLQRIEERLRHGLTAQEEDAPIKAVAVENANLADIENDSPSADHLPEPF